MSDGDGGGRVGAVGGSGGASAGDAESGGRSRLAVVSGGECAYLWDERGAVVVRAPADEAGGPPFAATGVAWSASGALRLEDRRQTHSMLVAFAEE